MPKRTFQPKTRRRARVHGFRARMSSKAGRLVLKARRLKQRVKISIYLFVHQTYNKSNMPLSRRHI